MINLAFKLPAEDAPVSGSIRVLRVSLTSERADDAVQALRGLVGRLPDHPGILPVIDAGVTDGRPFIVTPQITGDSLDSALDVYGPAAVDDALPRIRLLADALDLSAARGLCHGALAPQDIIVSAEETCLSGIGVADALAGVGVDLPREPRYTAPEVAAGSWSSAASDQYALAVIAHEWMFGGAVDPADGFVAVPSVPGIDSAAMQRVFETAVADEPAARHPSCLAFADALARSARGELAFEAPLVQMAMALEADELPLHAEVDAPPVLELGEPEPDEPHPEPEPEPERAGESNRSLSAPAVAATLILGLLAGAGGVWFLLDVQKAAQSRNATVQEFTEAPLTDAPAAAAPSTQATEVVDVPVTPPRDDVAPPRTADVAPRVKGAASRADAAPAAQADAGLLVHSTPAGAAVTVNGIARGVTPVAVRGLELGTHTVVITREGYRPIERQVALTAERPSRALEVPLVALPAANSLPGPTTARTAAAPPVAGERGSLVVDSRPLGAAVSVDGRAVGVTPLTLTDLVPGRRSVRIEHPGYRTVTTTVDVKAGERARVAVRLEGGQNEE